MTLAGEAGATAVFERSLEDQTLTFERTDDQFRMSDKETGSTWDIATGRAISGELQGKQLDRFPSFASFWFGWSDFHPKTEVWSS